MALRRTLIIPAVVRNEIAALKRRVVCLERELIRGIPERPVRTQTSVDLEVAEANARAKAEREFNDFLKARGIKPLPSRLPQMELAQRRTRR